MWRILARLRPTKPNAAAAADVSSYCTFNTALALPLPRPDPTSDPSVAHSNYTITQLSRAGKISDARHLFDQTPHRDVITWTALISAYIRHGNLHEARLLFDRPDATNNVVTHTALLSGYIRAKQFAEAERLFQQIPDKNIITYNTMVAGYADNGRIDAAYQLFDTMPERNLVSWNTIITALSRLGRIDDSYKLFNQMSERNVITWTAMVAGLSQNGRVDDARELFDRMPVRNVVSWNAMVSGYARNLRINEAYALFERMPERDVPSWNTMITGFIQNGDLVHARELFDRMRERNVVSWTTMITGYIQEGKDEAAFRIFSDMRCSGVRPNQGTFVSILSAVSNLAALHVGRQIHQIVSKSTYQSSPFVQSALVRMYAKCGEIGVAREMFDLSEQKDLVSWSGMIASYAHHGRGKEALHLFEEMLREGFKPDDVTYVGLLSACSHSGLVDEGIELFNSAARDTSIELREDHYACLVDLCGRAGRLDEAANFIKGLQTESSSSCLWGALLGGSNVHGDVSIGKLAAENILDKEPNNAGTLMLLSNIYASAGRWDEAKTIRFKMKDSGLKKQPGCSWISVDNVFHVFLSRDKSHNHTNLIYSILQGLHHIMKIEGYVPAIDHIANDD